MNRIITILFITVFNCISFHGIGQRISSSCQSSIEFSNNYAQSTYSITYNLIRESNLSYKDSIEFPSLLLDSVFKALTAVYNLDTLPESDSIYSWCKVKCLNNYELNYITFIADSNSALANALIQKRIPTGIKSFDSLYDYFKMSLNIASPGWPNGTAVILKLDDYYNVPVINKLLLKVPGIIDTGYIGSLADGSTIQCRFDSAYTSLKYIYKWQCPNFKGNCLFKRMWDFRIFPDCSVEYLGSSGDLLPKTGINNIENKSIQISPNPFSSRLFVHGVESPYSYHIYDITGKLMKSNENVNINEINLDQLDIGLYFIDIESTQGFTHIKIVKE